MSKKENEETHSEPIINPESQVQGEESQAEITDQASAPEGDAEKKIAELNDKYIRLYSDFDNFRKRTLKEKADIINSASSDVLKDLLVILDDFERAIANNDKVEDVTVLRESFKLIQHKLILALQNKGLESVDSKGEVFDADKHEAITNVPVTDASQKGKVIDVVERGYNLRGKTLRFAKVIVGQ
ncbi:MAG: nucleotide exchange factor GrpE [Bacteroidetes bacterium]|nr:nucleotide exchange factor GrpE [Bacteroidota bacterium]